MIRFEHIDKTYETEEGSTGVYRDFSEEIKDGEFIVLTGKSGSGKTTLLKMILRETEPESGKIFVDDEELSKIPRKKIPFYRRSIGVVFQDFRLLEEETVYDNLVSAIIASGGSGREAEKKITDVLTMLGIDHLHKRFPHELSGGEKQKVCIARAMINHPRIFLADEPTGNLDPASSEEIIKLLKIIHQRGITVILATNDPYVMGLDLGRTIGVETIQ